MPAGGRHFERAFGAFLAFDVGKVGEPADGFQDLRLRPRQHLRALEVVGELDQRGRGDDLDVGARSRRLGSAFGRADQAFATRIGADRRRQHARHRAIEPSRPSSPKTAKPDSASCGMAPIAAIRPSAIGRS